MHIDSNKDNLIYIGKYKKKYKKCLKKRLLIIQNMLILKEQK